MKCKIIKTYKTININICIAQYIKLFEAIILLAKVLSFVFKAN